MMFPQTGMARHPGLPSSVNHTLPFAHLRSEINNEKDQHHFRTNCPGYKNILKYVTLLTDHIHGKGNQILNSKYTPQSQIFKECNDFFAQLSKLCDDTDLNTKQNANYIRFGHLAYRDWFDAMKNATNEFINKLLGPSEEEFIQKVKDELSYYLSDSFGNRTRIDYGTGHELNFFIFTMGLILLVHAEGSSCIDNCDYINEDSLTVYVQQYGWDILHISMHTYMRLCRKVQIKFRLEPAGSRGVYNMDDFQYLPFLFGAAQLVGQKFVSANNFHDNDQVDMFKNEYIFMEAVHHILETKRGPFNEHSFTLWEYSNLGSWENILRRIRVKFVDEVLKPFPIVQHLLFGHYILRWTKSDEGEHS